MKTTRTFALIVAAGAGRRMEAPVPKAFLELGGRPLVVRSLERFQEHPEIDGIALVVPESRRGEAERIARPFTKIIAVLAGGSRRRDSVKAGLGRIASETGEDDLILIHDAARPFVDPDLIGAVRSAAMAMGAAVPGIRPVDTIRELAEDGASLGSRMPDRDRLIQVQTPQGFRIGLLRRGFDQAGEDDASDDASLVQRLGEPVAVVEGSPRNFKITTSRDLHLAERILSMGKEGA